MSDDPRYYLDTSAVFAREGGRSEVRDRVKLKLLGRKHATSTQVQREWNRITLVATVAVLKAVSSAKDWTDVIADLRKGFGGTPSRNWMVAHWITGSDTTDLDVVRCRAEDFRRSRHRVLLRAGIDTIRNGTDCGVAKRLPDKGKDGQWLYKPTCRKGDSICSQPEFLETQLDRAMAACEALETSDDREHQRMGINSRRSIEKLKGGNREASKGEACHAKNQIGGDISIALECGEGETLLTTDASFEFICPALDRKFERLT